MTSKDTNKYIPRMKSVRDMTFWLAAIRDTAHLRGDYHAYCAYDAALYYLNTGRLSALCEKAIHANIRAVLKRLNNSKADNSYEAIGDFLKGYYQCAERYEAAANEGVLDKASLLKLLVEKKGEVRPASGMGRSKQQEID